MACRQPNVVANEFGVQMNKASDRDSRNIRPATALEMPFIMGMAAAEGWNPGLHDGPIFHATDPSGFIIAEAGGAFAGAIAAVRYGEAFGFIGLFLVKHPFRHLLCGARLGRAALDYLGDRIVGTDGVQAKQEQYVRLAGFKRLCRNVRYQGVPFSRAVSSMVFEPADSVPFEALAAYDARHFGARRDVFLRGWLSAPEHMARVWRENGEVRALGVIRPCLLGYKIGPLFADSAELADEMFRCLVKSALPGAEVVLDVPEPNAQAVAMARKHGLAPVFETARMYRNNTPDFPSERIFGITTFELG